MSNLGIAIGGGKAFSVPTIGVIIAFGLVFWSGIVYAKRSESHI
ncbi:hypothetical protein [Desulfosporosinus shakirovi]|nr:hypothetical protein [Desulfosporosinus sp. SRJS8]